MNDRNWVNTIGKKRTAKMMQTRNANGYAETKKRAGNKRKKTIASAEWKETIGAMQYQNQSNTKANPVWKQANTTICPYCNCQFPE